MTQETILIFDFGSQYTQIIARRVREQGVYCEIHPCTKPYAGNEKLLANAKGVILSGGPSSVTDEDAPTFDSKWIESGVPVLGVCYGMQLFSQMFGGKLQQGKTREYGRMKIKIEKEDLLFSGFKAGSTQTVWMSHGDHVSEPAKGFEITAISESGAISAMSNPEKQMYSLQFHPEVEHSEKGREILANFLSKIVKCKGDWKPDQFITSTVEQIRSTVTKGSKVICGLSGGVDSTVAAVLVNKAIGADLHCIFVDTGLLRLDEGDKVEAMLGASGLGLSIERINAKDLFLNALKGVTDPEQKRKLIGKLFIDVFEKAVANRPEVTHLVQGTLYPDVIESVSFKGPSVTIKSHHNVGGLPEKMKLKLIEPLRELFKDEVRKIGAQLDIPSEILQRHPFPGPGLAIRILGEITEDRINKLQHADDIFYQEIKAAGLYNDIWQSLAVLLPIKSVGVMGDGRTYEETIALRAVTSVDGMTADWFFFPEDVLRKVSSRIVNEVKGINRVVLDISSKPPATVEWE